MRLGPAGLARTEGGRHRRPWKSRTKSSSASVEEAGEDGPNGQHAATGTLAERVRQLEHRDRTQPRPERDTGGVSMTSEEVDVIPGRVIEEIRGARTDRLASGMAGSSAEHDTETQTGLPRAQAPVDILEGEEIGFVQQADSLEGASVEHQNRARERRDGNNSRFVPRDISVADKSYAAPAQVNAHAPRLDSSVLLPKDHRSDRREGRVGDGVREESQAIGLQHSIAVEKEQSVTALGQELLQPCVHTSGEAAVLREAKVMLIRGDARSGPVLDDQDAGVRGACRGRGSGRVGGPTEVENHNPHSLRAHRVTV
jgi:hypothetical protein